MKTIAALFSVIALTACATGPNYQAAESSEFTQANYSAVDKLFAAPAVPIIKDAPLLIATMVNIDSLNQSSRFGRLISEQIATRLTQLGYNVVEMKLRNDPGGHFKLPHLWPGQIPPGRTTGKAGLLLGMGTLGKAAGGFFEAIALAAKLDQHATVQ